MATTNRIKYLTLLGLVLLVSGAVFAACELEEAGTSTEPTKTDTTKLLPYTENISGINVKYPDYATGDLGANYEFAVKHPEVLRFMPCYCGCGLTVEHISNLDCFIKGVDSNKNIVFDSHARNCAICQEIASDTERLYKEGKSLKDIRDYIDQTHGSKGPGSDTPLPP